MRRMRFWGLVVCVVGLLGAVATRVLEDLRVSALEVGSASSPNSRGAMITAGSSAMDVGDRAKGSLHMRSNGTLEMKGSNGTAVSVLTTGSSNPADVFVVTDTTGLTNALAAATTNTRIVGAPGTTFTVTDTVNFLNKTNVTLEMYGCIVVSSGAGMAGKPVIEMTGANNCAMLGGTYRGAMSDTNKTACSLFIARASSSTSAAGNVFRDVIFEGYHSVAAVVNKASEVNLWDGCSFTNWASVAGGATTFYCASSGTVSGITTIDTTPGDNTLLVQSWRACRFTRFVLASDGSPHVADDSLVVLDATTSRIGDLSFRDCLFSSGTSIPTGTVAGIVEASGYPDDQSTTYKGVVRMVLGDSIYGATFDNCRAETLGARSVFYVVSGSSSLIGLDVRPNCTWSYCERFFVGSATVLSACNISLARSTFSGSYDWAYTTASTFNTASVNRRRSLFVIDGAPDSTIDASYQAGYTCQHSATTTGTAANRTVGPDGSGLYTPWCVVEIFDDTYMNYPSTNLRMVYPTDVMAGAGTSAPVEKSGTPGLAITAGASASSSGGARKMEQGFRVGGSLNANPYWTVDSSGILTGQLGTSGSAGGALLFTAGAGDTNGAGGAFGITAGAAAGNGTGGTATLSGGASAGASGTGGNAVIKPGSKAGGTAGYVDFQDGSGTSIVSVREDGLYIGADTRFYRSAADNIQTPDSLRVTGNFRCDGTVTMNGATLPTLTASTYTPTLSNTTNVAASTAYACQYMQLGTTITVSGHVDVDPTTTGSTVLGISLPVASNFTAAGDCGGAAAATGIAGQSAGILGDAANDRALLQWIAVDVTNQPMYFSFTYQVK